MTQESHGAVVYVRTTGGAVHSIAPGADIPEGWEQISEEDARTVDPRLFGEPDPAVTFCELRG